MKIILLIIGISIVCFLLCVYISDSNEERGKSLINDILDVIIISDTLDLLFKMIFALIKCIAELFTD